MKIYLVRHAQKEVRLDNIHPKKRSISKVGENQAEAFAQYAKENLSINRIFTSPYLRTRQTAEIIGKKINIEPEINEDIGEVGIKEYFNILHFDKKKIKIFEKEFINKLLNFSKGQDSVLLVTHSGFLRILKAILSKPEDIQTKINYLFKPYHNLGLTILEIEDSEISILEFDKADFLTDNLKNKFPY